LRILQEKYGQKIKTLYNVFVDLEKAFDPVPRKVIEWAVRRKGIAERMVEEVMALYVSSRTRVKAFISEEFNIHGSFLSPLVFIIIMDELTKEIRKGVPWELMFADDVALQSWK